MKRRPPVPSFVSLAHEVCVFFHDVLLRGNRVIKRDALGLAAFDSPNLPPLARIGVAMAARDELLLPPPPPPPGGGGGGGLRTMLDMETRVLVARMVPGFDDGVLKQIFGSRTVKAVVLELYGTGTAPLTIKRAAPRVGGRLS